MVIEDKGLMPAVTHAQTCFSFLNYLAVRDSNGSYKGTIEVSRDVTSIRRHEGEKRLLDRD